METEIQITYQIFQITESGHVHYGDYGYDRTFKWCRFETMQEAVEYLTEEMDAVPFGAEYVILPVVEKVHT